MNSQTKTRNTIAFTLPISCQICLGKVKQPVVCSNQHVFCGPCLQVWLERNTVCPTCRVPITGSGKPVLGGLNPDVERQENFSDRELRRSRMELIYKEYEGEIDRLEVELTACREENKNFRAKVKDTETVVKPSNSPQEKSMITMLNNKLKDATNLYENIRVDMDKIRQENASLRNVIQDMNREKHSLKLEVESRSPRKFGRYTVAALETKLEASEKQVKQLERALEKSDSYIEDIEEDLEKHRQVMCPQCAKKMAALPLGKSRKGRSEKDSLDFDSSTVELNESSRLDSELPSRISNVSDDDTDYRFSDTERTKRHNLTESFELEGPKSERSSFILEMPSPMGAGSSSRMTSDGEGSFLAAKGKAKASGPSIDTTKKRLRFMVSDDEVEDVKPGILRHTNGAGQDFPVMSMPPASSYRHRLLYSTANGAASSSQSHSTQVTSNGNSSLNVSMTPEIEDCFKLMDEAERKLGAQETASSSSGMSSSLSQSSQHLIFNHPALPTSAFSASVNGTHSQPLPHGMFSASVPAPSPSLSILPTSLTATSRPFTGGLDTPAMSQYVTTLPAGHPLVTSVFPSHNIASASSASVLGAGVTRNTGGPQNRYTFASQ